MSKEIKPCFKCFSEVEIEKVECYKNCWSDSLSYKYIIKCPNCGFELRRNGRKHRKDLIFQWNSLYDKKNWLDSSNSRATD